MTELYTALDRDEIIEQIYHLKENAVALGFDWPVKKPEDEPDTEVLLEFLNELEDFFDGEFNSN